MTTTANTIAVAKVAVKGNPIDGVYKVLSGDDKHVVIQHPQYGKLRVARAYTSVPASSQTTLDYDELLADIRDRFDTLGRIVDGIIAGNTRSVIVSGAPGVGKSHTTETKLRVAQLMGKVRNVKYVKGVLGALTLYKTLYNYRCAGNVVVVDDAEEIFFDSNGANIIKAATDSGKTRVVSYMKEVASLEAEGIPQDFEFEGAIIVATNLDLEAEVAKETKSSKHIGAILNRALYLDLGLHTNQALMARVEDVSRNTKMLREQGLDSAQIETLIQWLKDNQSAVRSMSLRTAMLLATRMVSEPNTWRKTAKSTLLRAASR